MQVLDDLHGAVSRVKSMAGQMHEELASQNRMIGTSPNLSPRPNPSFAESDDRYEPQPVP